MRKEKIEHKGNENELYEINYYCQKCNYKIGVTYHKNGRMIGQRTVVKDNLFPIFCPNCGEKITGGRMNKWK